MRPTTTSDDDAAALVTTILGAPPARVTRGAIGFGNENWRVVDATGAQLLLKIGPGASAAKWNSAHRAHELAHAAGVPLAPLRFSSADESRVVRLYEWVDGQSPARFATDPVRIQRFFTDLASAVATIHSIALDGFSSRLDGSAPTFARWSEYIGYRLSQVQARCRANDAVDTSTLEHASSAITAAVAVVDDDAQLTLCHRDLHADNLLVDDDGALLAIVDWDTAEAWDQAGEWFRMETQLFPAFPDGAATFERVYGEHHPLAPRWEDRKRVVDLIETLNIVANAVSEGWSADFENRNRARLARLLSEA